MKHGNSFLADNTFPVKVDDITNHLVRFVQHFNTTKAEFSWSIRVDVNSAFYMQLLAATAAVTAWHVKKMGSVSLKSVKEALKAHAAEHKGGNNLVDCLRRVFVLKDALRLKVKEEPKEVTLLVEGHDSINDYAIKKRHLFRNALTEDLERQEALFAFAKDAMNKEPDSGRKRGKVAKELTTRFQRLIGARGCIELEAITVLVVRAAADMAELKTATVLVTRDNDFAFYAPTPWALCWARDRDASLAFGPLPHASWARLQVARSFKTNENSVYYEMLHPETIINVWAQMRVPTTLAALGGKMHLRIDAEAAYKAPFPVLLLISLTLGAWCEYVTDRTWGTNRAGEERSIKYGAYHEAIDALFVKAVTNNSAPSFLDVVKHLVAHGGVFCILKDADAQKRLQIRFTQGAAVIIKGGWLGNVVDKFRGEFTEWIRLADPFELPEVARIWQLDQGRRDVDNATLEHFQARATKATSKICEGAATAAAAAAKKPAAPTVHRVPIVEHLVRGKPRIREVPLVYEDGEGGFKTTNSFAVLGAPVPEWRRVRKREKGKSNPGNSSSQPAVKGTLEENIAEHIKTKEEDREKQGQQPKKRSKTAPVSETKGTSAASSKRRLKGRDFQPSNKASVSGISVREVPMDQIDALLKEVTEEARTWADRKKKANQRKVQTRDAKAKRVATRNAKAAPAGLSNQGVQVAAEKKAARPARTSNKPVSAALGTKKAKFAVKVNVERQAKEKRAKVDDNSGVGGNDGEEDDDDDEEEEAESAPADHSYRVLPLAVSWIPKGSAMEVAVNVNVARYQLAHTFAHNLNRLLTLGHGVALVSPAAIYALCGVAVQGGTTTLRTFDAQSCFLRTETELKDALLPSVSQAQFEAAVTMAINEMCEAAKLKGEHLTRDAVVDACSTIFSGMTGMQVAKRVSCSIFSCLARQVLVFLVSLVRAEIQLADQHVRGLTDRQIWQAAGTKSSDPRMQLLKELQAADNPTDDTMFQIEILEKEVAEREEQLLKSLSEREREDLQRACEQVPKVFATLLPQLELHKVDGGAVVSFIPQTVDDLLDFLRWENACAGWRQLGCGIEEDGAHVHEKVVWARKAWKGWDVAEHLHVGLAEERGDVVVLKHTCQLCGREFRKDVKPEFSDVDYRNKANSVIAHVRDCIIRALGREGGAVDVTKLAGAKQPDGSCFWMLSRDLLAMALTLRHLWADKRCGVIEHVLVPCSSTLATARLNNDYFVRLVRGKRKDSTGPKTWLGYWVQSIKEHIKGIEGTAGTKEEIEQQVEMWNKRRKELEKLVQATRRKAKKSCWYIEGIVTPGLHPSATFWLAVRKPKKEIRNRAAYAVEEEMRNFVAGHHSESSGLAEYLVGWSKDEWQKEHSTILYRCRWNRRTGWTSVSTLVDCFNGQDNEYGPENAHFLARLAPTGWLDGGMRYPFAGVLAADKTEFNFSISHPQFVSRTGERSKSDDGEEKEEREDVSEAQKERAKRVAAMEKALRCAACLSGGDCKGEGKQQHEHKHVGGEGKEEERVFAAALPSDGLEEVLSRHTSHWKVGCFAKEKAERIRELFDKMGFPGDIVLFIGSEWRDNGGTSYSSVNKKRFLDVLANYFLLVKTPESWTSQPCPLCLLPADYIDKAMSLRRKVCRCCRANGGVDYFFDRDCGAGAVLRAFVIDWIFSGQRCAMSLGRYRSDEEGGDEDAMDEEAWDEVEGDNDQGWAGDGAEGGGGGGGGGDQGDGEEGGNEELKLGRGGIIAPRGQGGNGNGHGNDGTKAEPQVAHGATHGNQHEGATSAKPSQPARAKAKRASAAAAAAPLPPKLMEGKSKTRP